ncbi:MAG TPA: response regulator transcription factor [Terriglobia bacterium]|nr:response regulator transcription factor [Terriglobia bacterium]
MNANILIIDDHEIVREGVRNLLARMRPNWEICGEAGSSNEGIQAATALRPDLIVLDITMPDGSGLEAAARITRMGLGCRILMFTMHESAGLEEEIRNSGAHGYVVKSQAVRDLVRAMDRLLGGGTFFDQRPVPDPKKQDSDTPGITSRSSLALRQSIATA